MSDHPCSEEQKPMPLFTTCSGVQKAEVIIVTDKFGLGTEDSPRRSVCKYYDPDTGHLLAVHDSLEGDPSSRLYPDAPWRLPRSDIKGSSWTIHRDDDGIRFWFSHSVNGLVRETYRPASQAEAAVWAAAIVQGFEPPLAMDRVRDEKGE